MRYHEGLTHGFLGLIDSKGKLIASGEVIQTLARGRITAELVFHFKDGSLHNETAVYTQNGTFQLLHYGLVQRGKSFKHSVSFSLDVPSGKATLRDFDDDGKARTATETMKLPADLANGMISTLLLQLDPATPRTTLSYVALTPKPRLVKLEVKPAGEDSFHVGILTKKAICYDIAIDIGGVAGLIAPLIGKQPPDFHICLMGGRAPEVVRMEGPLALGGPIWRIQLASPVFTAEP